LVEPRNQDRRLGGRRQDPSTPRTFEAEDTRWDRKACVEAKQGAVVGHPPDCATTTIPKVPLGACILVLCNRGSFVFRLSPYILIGQRMAAISRNPSSFALAIFPAYFP
jgi:hypothetical protein